jgi:hypothetical protein
MNAVSRRGECRELICIKTKSIIHIDWGNVEVIEGKVYREFISGFGYLKENISDDYTLIEVNGMLWPFPKINFSTLVELRDEKINQLLDGK